MLVSDYSNIDVGAARGSDYLSAQGAGTPLSAPQGQSVNDVVDSPATHGATILSGRGQYVAGLNAYGVTGAWTSIAQIANGGGALNLGSFAANSSSSLAMPDLLSIPTIFTYSNVLSPTYVLKDPYWDPTATGVNSSLGDGVNSLISDSRIMTSEYDYLTASGWNIAWGSEKEASNTDTTSSTIYISGAYKDKPLAAFSQLSHEFGHALTNPTVFGWQMGYSSADQGYIYAATNTNVLLTSEGYATLNNVAVQKEIQNEDGVNIQVASANPSVNVPQYQSIYNNYVNGNVDSYVAAQQIGGIYRFNETPGGDQTIPRGEPFSTNGSYGVHYFNSYLNSLYNYLQNTNK